MAAPMSPHSSQAMCCHTSPKMRLRRVFDSALLMTTSVSTEERVRSHSEGGGESESESGRKGKNTVRVGERALERE